jgi:hypothetical protein
MELDLESDRRSYPIELTMAKKISELAKRQGVSAETPESVGEGKPGDRHGHNELAEEQQHNPIVT